MYTAPELVREHNRARLEQAERARHARAVWQIRKLRRVQQRAERRLLRAWQRGDELRALIEAR